MQLRNWYNKRNKKECGFEHKIEVIPITKEKFKLGNDALEEILNDDNDNNEKKNYDNDSKTKICTEIDESQKSDLLRLDDDKAKQLEMNIVQNDWDN